MKVLSAEFVVSAAVPSDCPPGGRPEVAFLGRSNVGKSSLINSLLNRRRLAQTSRTPGKTRTMNFFLVNDSFLFVDLPGYGYASVSRKLREGWESTVGAYLAQRSALRAAVFLVDLRHPPTKLDLQMKNWLDHYSLPVIVVATKEDKVGASRRERRLREVREALSLAEEGLLLPYSARTGHGKARLWSALATFLK